jgi:hypothetical protein
MKFSDLLLSGAVSSQLIRDGPQHSNAPPEFVSGRGRDLERRTAELTDAISPPFRVTESTPFHRRSLPTGGPPYQRRDSSPVYPSYRREPSFTSAYRRTGSELSEISFIQQEQLRAAQARFSAANSPWWHGCLGGYSRATPPPLRVCDGDEHGSFEAYLRYRESALAREMMPSASDGRWEAELSQQPWPGLEARSRHNGDILFPPAEGRVTGRSPQIFYSAASYYQSGRASQRIPVNEPPQRGQKRFWGEEDEHEDHSFSYRGEQGGVPPSTREAINKQVPAKHQRAPATSKTCSNCHTSDTPFWRKGKDDGLPLCNACGLYYTKNNMPRPMVLWKTHA